MKFNLSVLSKLLPSKASNPYIAAATAQNTRRGYQSDLKRFLESGYSIPASANEIEGYLLQNASQYAPATLTRWLAAIAKAHIAAGLPDPTSDPLIRTTMKGIRRAHSDHSIGRKQTEIGSTRGKVKALMLDDLKNMVRAIENNRRGRRDKAVLLVGFMSACRRSELEALTLADVQFCEQGVVLNVRESKTDQEGFGRLVEIPYAADQNLCPVRALQAWIDLDLGITAPQDSPLFRSIDRHGNVGAKLQGKSIAAIVKKHAAANGLDESQFAGHSLRAGFATAAAEAEKPTWMIRKTTGHKSDAVLQRYIRAGQAFKSCAANGLL